jgi:hypothetical protein
MFENLKTAGGREGGVGGNRPVPILTVDLIYLYIYVSMYLNIYKSSYSHAIAKRL